MQEAPAEGRCRYCGTPLEQPSTGGRQKLFCSDEHRLRYWRERRRQGVPSGEEGSERPADVRPLTWELQATLLGFQHTVQALATALADAGDVDAASAQREQADAEAQRRIAAAEERRARAERLRLEAEAMAEAASAAARDAQERAQRLEFEAARLRAGTAAAEARARQVEDQAQERITAAQEDLARAVELRDVVQQRNGQLEAELAAQRQARAAAEQQAGALAQLAEERARERDRLVRLMDRVRDSQSPRSRRQSATSRAAGPESGRRS